MSTCPDIVSVVERISGATTARIASELAGLNVNGSFRRFVIGRMGSTGSTWLAKLLDSHPEVNCTHEGILPQVFPRQRYADKDVLRFLRQFAWDTKHNAYQVAGDVGSVWASHLPFLPFTTALLLRHPARVLHTRLRVYPTDQSFTDVRPESRACIREIWGIDLNRYDPLDQVFLSDAFIFASQVAVVGKINLVIRIEDMNLVEYAHNTLHALTGLTYNSEIVQTLIRKRENRRTGLVKPISQIVSGFSARQRDWYHAMLHDAVGVFGYSLLDEPERPARTPRRSAALVRG